MDSLQAKHAFDQIENYLAQVKEDVLQNASNGSSYGDLEDSYHDLECENEELEEKISELESLLCDARNEHAVIVRKLESFLFTLRDSKEQADPEHLQDIIDSIKAL